MTQLSPYPALENTLMLFVAHLHNEGLVSGTMKSYLAAIRHEQISINLGDPQIPLMPQLEYVLKGAKLRATVGARKRLPITPMILQQMRKVWLNSANRLDGKLL